MKVLLSISMALFVGFICTMPVHASEASTKNFSPERQEMIRRLQKQKEELPKFKQWLEDNKYDEDELQKGRNQTWADCSTFVSLINVQISANSALTSLGDGTTLARLKQEHSYEKLDGGKEFNAWFEASKSNRAALEQGKATWGARNSQFKSRINARVDVLKDEEEKAKKEREVFAKVNGSIDRMRDEAQANLDRSVEQERLMKRHGTIPGFVMSQARNPELRASAGRNWKKWLGVGTLAVAVVGLMWWLKPALAKR